MLRSRTLITALVAAVVAAPAALATAGADPGGEPAVVERLPVLEEPSTSPTATAPDDGGGSVVARETPDGSRFEGWDVTVRKDPGYDHEQILEVAFDSPVLGQRTIMLVWLPDVYAAADEPLPTLYYLHGTTAVNSFGVAEAMDEQGLTAPFGLDPSSGRGSPFNVGFHQHLDEQRFVVVAPDMQDPAWCGHCWWVDGRDGQGVDAETHLFDEVIPLTEHLFDVVTDRSGRAILGASMGANGALLQAFRHPDRFVFAGGLSPTTSGYTYPFPPRLHEHGTRVWSEYLEDQGYGPPAQEEVHHRAIEPVNLTPQMLTADVEIVAVNGDGCLPTTPDEGACAGANPHPGEFRWHKNMRIWSSLLVERGVEHTWIEREGPHGGINRDSYERSFLPRINARFAAGARPPAHVSYRTIDERFSIWGYDVVVERPNTEFLSLLDARTDGRGLTMAGTGQVTVTTPPVIERGKRSGRAFRVVGTPDSAPGWEQTVVTDGQGRLTFAFELAPGRDVDERIDLVRAGLFPFPRTHIEITPIE